MVAKWIGRAGTPMEKGLAAGRGISLVRAAAVGGSGHLSPSASRCGGHRSRDTDQVVCGSYGAAGELRPLQPDEARPSDSPDRFHPAEDLFDQFAVALTDRIAKVSCGAPVDGAAPPTGG